MNPYAPVGWIKCVAALLVAMLLVTAPYRTLLYGDERATPAERTQRKAGADTRPELMKSNHDRRPFLVFDAMMYRGQPDMTQFGMRPLNLIGGRLWRGGEAATQPKENHIRAVARRASRRGQLVCLDIEHWETRHASDEATTKNIQKLARVADWMHDASPDVRLGFYRLLPARDYWTPVNGKPEAIVQWHKHNERIKSLARHVDVVFPSLYTFYNKPDDWETYARANLRQAQQYQKQVYVFLWPAFHDSNDALGGQPIPGDFWRRQLEVCYEEADGIVIWGGWQQEWDEDAQWWAETRLFLKTLRENDQ